MYGGLSLLKGKYDLLLVGGVVPGLTVVICISPTERALAAEYTTKTMTLWFSGRPLETNAENN